MKHLKSTALVLLFAASLMVTGCSSDSASNSQGGVSESAKDPAVTQDLQAVDAQTLFDNIHENITFTDTMEVVTDDYSQMLTGVDASLYSDCVLYMGSGATAEELLTFQAASADAADSIMTALNTHIEDQKTAFAGYDPEELEKLGNAYIASNSSIVVCCVCNDIEAAKNAITAGGFSEISAK